MNVLTHLWPHQCSCSSNYEHRHRLALTSKAETLSIVHATFLGQFFELLNQQKFSKMISSFQVISLSSLARDSVSSKIPAILDLMDCQKILNDAMDVFCIDLLSRSHSFVMLNHSAKGVFMGSPEVAKTRFVEGWPIHFNKFWCGRTHLRYVAEDPFLLFEEMEQRKQVSKQGRKQALKHSSRRETETCCRRCRLNPIQNDVQFYNVGTFEIRTESLHEPAKLELVWHKFTNFHRVAARHFLRHRHCGRRRGQEALLHRTTSTSKTSTKVTVSERLLCESVEVVRVMRV